MMTLSDEVVKSLFALGCAICGAAIGAMIKGYFDARGRERRELTVWKTTPTKLVMMASDLAPRVEIQFDGKKVATLASSEVQAVNTGNRAISNITLSIEIDGDAELISAEPSAVSPNLRDVEIKPSGKCITITAPFMNPGEEILLRLLTAGHDFKMAVTFRQPDVTYKERDQEERELPHPAMAALLDVIRSSLLMDLYFKALMPGYRRYVRSLERKSGNAKTDEKDLA